jgi:hypothetical protein
MGFFKFSAVLTREITEEEFAILQEAGCAGGTLSTSVLPTSDNLVVTQIDFDKAEAETLYDAMQRVLDALTKVPKLSAFSLDVPEQSVGQAPAAAENSQAEPEPVPDDGVPVTAEIEIAAEPAEAAANGTAEADLESAHHNCAANGTAFTADEAVAAAEPTFAASQLV